MPWSVDVTRTDPLLAYLRARILTPQNVFPFCLQRANAGAQTLRAITVKQLCTVRSFAPQLTMKPQSMLAGDWIFPSLLSHTPSHVLTGYRQRHR